MPKSLITGLSREDAQRMRMLVVDDNEYMRRVICEFLRVMRIGTIKDATNGAEALDLLRSFQPDLIFVDWRMERLDGLEFVKRVRTDPGSANPYVPIIMVTGYADGTRVKAARDAGVNELLVKPVSLATLAQRVAVALLEPRPFIRVSGYYGPDRRRRAQPFAGTDRRRIQEGVVSLREIQERLRHQELSDAV